MSQTNNNTVNHEKARFRNKLYVLLMVAIFLAPLMLAKYYYFHGDVKIAATNQGQLLTNPHNVSELHLNKPFIQSADAWRDKRWHIIYQPPKKCDRECEQVIYKLQQVHIALGKNKDRLQRVLIHNNNISNNLDHWRYIYDKYPHMTMTSFTNKNLTNNNIISSRKVYIADPLGNIIMSYNINDDDLSNFDSKIFKDTKRLLSVSRIG